jgi:hypothetical protein
MADSPLVDWPPEEFGRWIPVGPDVWITTPVEIANGVKRSWLAHKRKDGRNDSIGRVEFSPGHHTLVSEDPLHIEPSLLCPDPACGLHGFIRDGKWETA